MNRLKYSMCYLVGPMDCCREEGQVWRDEITTFLEELGVIVLNPYDKPLHPCHKDDLMVEDEESFLRRQKYKEVEAYDDLTKAIKPICHVDLRMVDKADFEIVYLNFEVIMSGTIEEIWTSNREKKPIIVFSNVPKNKIPDWYFGRLPHKLFFENLDEVKKYITHIDSDEKIDTLNRWIFFDLEEKIKKIK